MKIDNMKAQMRKGVLEMCILSLLSAEEMYTSDIIDRLRNAQLVVVEGTLYPLLTRLKNDGLLEYYWQESNSGPPRKYFKITSEGNNFLRELRDSWEEINQAVSITSQNIQIHE
ncbi:MAG: PadR family transcriptional regulator [Saprospiraceae bacterium]|uniref:PadR family transcriptional regulator n=1 Tax=Candidatus Opimibacter skivensis TaxID=2982028 RepID=A0A9D7T1Z8_9BACT|nr:PadR family transcriptional regulator [Candidatus Opimibacter skivensis]